jgi:hypothetical protein
MLTLMPQTVPDPSGSSPKAFKHARTDGMDSGLWIGRELQILINKLP